MLTKEQLVELLTSRPLIWDDFFFLLGLVFVFALLALLRLQLSSSSSSSLSLQLVDRRDFRFVLEILTSPSSTSPLAPPTRLTRHFSTPSLVVVVVSWSTPLLPLFLCSLFILADVCQFAREMMFERFDDVVGVECVGWHDDSDVSSPISLLIENLSDFLFSGKSNDFFRLSNRSLQLSLRNLISSTV